MPTIITGISQIARAYNISNINVVRPSNGNPYDGKIDKTITQDTPLYESSLGTPVFTDLTFKGATYTDTNGKLVSFDDMTFYTVLMIVTQPKNIIKTPIQGSDGTVKEYIGMDDYQVVINGIINGANGSYPFADVRSLKDILNAPIPIDVVSSYLQNLDIYTLVVDESTFDQEAGGYSYQRFTINCISDVPQELQITQQ